MIDKDYVKDLYKQGHSLTRIGLEVGVSKQRVYQVVKNYRNTGRQGRRKRFYSDMEECELCHKTVAVVLHHKDKDNSHDAWENLEKLCISCHGRRHRGKRHKQVRRKKSGMKRDRTLFDKLLAKKIGKVPLKMKRYLLGEDINNV